MYNWNIPLCCQKDVSENVEHIDCVRLVKNSKLSHIDFLPTIIEEKNRSEKWKTHVGENCGDFSVSLFETLEKAKKFRGLLRSHPHIAIGKTNIERGVATNPTKNGHIDYFLFDYEKKSPYVDFSLIVDNGEKNE